MENDKIRFFRTYWEGMKLNAMIRPGISGGKALDVDYVDESGKHHPHFSHCYKDERGAIRAMSTRFRGAEWEEYT